MKELKYQKEVIAVLVMCCVFALVGVTMNDRIITMFFMLPFPLSIVTAAMWKEGRL